MTLFNKLANTTRPAVSAVAVITLNAVLIAAVYWTLFSLPWIAFLSGILVAAILAEATRVSRAEWQLLRRTAQLSALKDKFDKDAHLRKTAEAAVEEAKPRLHLIDEVMPTMVALVDTEGRCRYHNRSFRNWLHLRTEQINGHHMNEILGSRIYQEIAPYVRQSMDGHLVKYERTQTMQGGAVFKLAVEHLPQIDGNGKTIGFYMISDDITGPGDVLAHPEAHAGIASQELFVDTFSEHLTGREDAVGEIVSAIEQNKFRLYSQRITPLAASHGSADCHEILVRLAEEEEGMMPPGAFFPLAEKHGLMSKLDRWVVQHVVEQIARMVQKGAWREGTVMFLNVSEATIEDHGFPDYLEVILLEYGVPGASLCFEITCTELSLQKERTVKFAQRIKQQDCRIALSGFGRDKVAFDHIRGFQADFLKIDGSVILNILRDPVQLAKVVAVNEVAKKIGVKTIAEFVENEQIRDKLEKAGTDFAQGFGVALPEPFGE
jgi:PAS domain S-box-containing protein